MKKNLLRVAILVVACALTLSGQAFAGNGTANGLKTKTATKAKTQLKTQTPLKTKSQLKTCK